MFIQTKLFLTLMWRFTFAQNVYTYSLHQKAVGSLWEPLKAHSKRKHLHQKIADILLQITRTNFDHPFLWLFDMFLYSLVALEAYERWYWKRFLSFLSTFTANHSMPWEWRTVVYEEGYTITNPHQKQMRPAWAIKKSPYIWYGVSQSRGFFYTCEYFNLMFLAFCNVMLTELHFLINLI